jgi:hypothetical protein
MRAMSSALLLSGCMLLAGCAHVRSVTRGLETPADMTKAISASVSVGTSVQDAQKFMEQEGFTCSQTVNGEWGERKGVDYLYCDRTEGGAVVSRRWQVAICHADGKVTEVLANTGLIGP